MKNNLVIPVILCGGSGTRLWPVSRECQPKQFLNLLGEFSLLQDTARRAINIAGADVAHVVTVTLDKLKDQVEQHMSAINPLAARHILSEPCARNTAAALAYAASYVRDVFGEDSIMWVLPSDHYIGNELALKAALEHAIEAANNNYLVTFGIKPSRADTGYGYIKTGAPLGSAGVCMVKKFVEKPDFETAHAYVESGDYLWNSGMFVFKTKTVIEQFSYYELAIIEGVQKAMATGTAYYPEAGKYAELINKPFDKAILEKSDRVVTVSCDPAWSDIGSWESLWEIRSKDEDGNALEGRTMCQDTRDCFVLSKKKLIACVGIEHLIIAETDDAILIADRRNAVGMKELVNNLKATGFMDGEVKNSLLLSISENHKRSTVQE